MMERMQKAETRRKTRVAILGGGVGGVSTAFWLTTSPELRERFEVTLYSRGWRLGGKAATGRNLEHGARIEEHGLHMLMGCYQNAFRTIRACYAAWQPPADNRIRTWQEAFAPERDVYMWDGSASRYWHVPFPTLPGMPGDSAATPIRKLLQALIDRITLHFRSASLWSGTEFADEIRTRLDDVRRVHNRPLDEEVHRQATMHLDALHRLHAGAKGWRNDVRDEARHLWILLDIGLAMAKGIWRDVLLHILGGGIQNALDRLDEKDFRH
jgi:uncharacterized protein with NAD-binding domain and iron-sulfur cluster